MDKPIEFRDFDPQNTNKIWWVDYLKDGKVHAYNNNPDTEFFLKNFNFFDLQKNEGRQVHWINIDARGPLLFSYDLKTIYNYFGDYPNNLTFDQKKVFDMENPELAY